MLFWVVVVFVALFWRCFPLAYHVRVVANVVLAQLFMRKPKSFSEETVLSFRCWPDDLDWNMHMNNSSYNKIADFARIAHLARFFPKNVNGANGGVFMRFKRSIRPFQAYTVKTRIVGCDEKWLWLEHRFFVGNRCLAAGMVKLLIPEARTFIPDLPLPEQATPEISALLLKAEQLFGRDN